MSSLFTKIINGDIPCHKIGETERCFAFLDINPLQKGHVLVVPKKEEDKLFDLDNTSFLELMSFAKTVSKAIEKSFECNRVGMAVIGLEVPHAHVHLIPISSMNDMNFANQKLKLSSEELTRIAHLIASNL